MEFFQSSETKEALNMVGENIFVADLQFNIVWINDYADKLIKEIGRFVRIEKKEDLYGRNISEFHRGKGERQKGILTNGSFPYETTIDLFNRFTASIVVNPLVLEGQNRGYILTWKDVTEYESEIKEGQKRIEELYTPIMETSMDGVLLVPVIGTMTEDRIQKMIQKVLEECARHQANYVIFDFSGMTKVEDEHILLEFDAFGKSLSLMGVNMLCSGFTIEMVKVMVKYSINVKEQTFGTFKQAIRYIAKKEA